MEMRGRDSDKRNRGNHVCIDIENSPEIVDSLRQKLEKLPLLSSECCIYRAPKHLREKAEKSFIPKIVSIGPFHHKREDLQDMEKHKLRYLKQFLQRSEVSLEDCIKLIHKSELRLRNCYAESIELNHIEFVEMILVDAAFIIEFLMRISFPELTNCHDYILGRSQVLSSIAQDMFMLENQLPFFIIEDLLTLAKVSFPSHNDARVILIELLCKFFKTVLLRNRRFNVEKLYTSRIEHLLDFLRSSLLPPELPVQRKLKTLSIPNVTQLYHSGVKFRVVKHGNSSHIRFHQGILELPVMHLCTSTETQTRNLMAYERSHFNDAYINNLVFLIDRLIDSPSDVEILIDNQILETDLPDSQGVATFVNKIAPGAPMPGDNFYFADVCDDLNAYCRVPWHRWKATLKREYFRTPWAVISVIAVTVLLFLTFLQTVFTIYSSSSSETLIRNLIAYERCHFNDAYMNNLLFLIDRLIDSLSDVEILIHNQILETDLPDSQGAATFINNISPGGTIPGDKFYFADVCDDLNAYCRVPWHKWKATLKREYFSTPWSAISVIAVTVLLFLTFLQTVFTVYSSSCH